MTLKWYHILGIIVLSNVFTYGITYWTQQHTKQKDLENQARLNRVIQYLDNLDNYFAATESSYTTLSDRIEQFSNEMQILRIEREERAARNDRKFIKNRTAKKNIDTYLSILRDEKDLLLQKAKQFDQ